MDSSMTLLKYPQLSRLTPRRKRALADALWSASFDDSAPVTEAQRRLVDSRAAEIDSGDARLVSWTEVKKRAAARR